MPKITLKNKNGLIDVSELVSEIRWSGSNSEIARSMEIQLLYPLHDYLAPKIYPNIGDMMYLYDDEGNELFQGRVFYNERLSEQGTIQITCYDDAIRLSKSKGTYNFKKKTAETITRTVCNDLGLSVGKIASTCILQKMLCQDTGMYDIIKDAYKGASLQNKKRYLFLMQNGKLNVIEYGGEVIPYVLNADTNILESSYSENAENVINRVKIYDKNDKYIGVVENKQLISLLGVFQDVYKKEKGKQAKTVASNMIQGIEKSVDVTVIGNVECMSGKAIKVEDPITKLTGLFYIESDTHSWSNGQYTTSMTLKFKG